MKKVRKPFNLRLQLYLTGILQGANIIGFYVWPTFIFAASVVLGSIAVGLVAAALGRQIGQRDFNGTLPEMTVLSLPAELPPPVLLSFTCAVCGRTSYNPMDRLTSWCGYCEQHTSDVSPAS